MPRSLAASPRESARAACPRLAERRGFTVLIATDGFTSQRVADAAEQLAIRTLLASPFARDGLDARDAGELVPGICRVATRNSLSPTLRCSPALNPILARCGAGHFELVVLSARTFTSRAAIAVPSKSSAAFVSTSDDAWPRYLLHELGHTLGLRDERARLEAKSRSPARMPGPNCTATRAEARRRWGDLIARGEAGLHRGCAGHARWLRPDARTVMGFPRETTAFGAASTRYLRDAIRCCFTRHRRGCGAAAKRNPELEGCTR